MSDEMYALVGTETKEIIVDKIPCGRSITTVYRDSAGDVVRRDVNIEVDEGIIMGIKDGKL
jgi:hypothetical protein